MRVTVESTETYLYLSGLATERNVRLSEWVELIPVQTTLSADVILSLGKTNVDFSIISLFLPYVRSQLKIQGPTPKATVTLAWNAIHDGMRIGAFVGTEVMCNLQSDVPVEKLTSKSKISVTNYELRGLAFSPYVLTHVDIDWIEKNYSRVSTLDDEAYSNALYCLATYRWHSMPRARLAMLWAGIEGLFKVDSEISFRVSLYVAHFLEPSDQLRRRNIFENVRKLYSLRSRAVHGGKLGYKAFDAVDQSASLLSQLVKKCAEIGSLPHIDNIIP